MAYEPKDGHYEGDLGTISLSDIECDGEYLIRLRVHGYYGVFYDYVSFTVSSDW